MDRSANLSAIKNSANPFDIAIVGGGATGASIALDAASRGLKTVLLEQADFGQGTSSRSTKLVHGGVRYLAQGNVSLVREALHERSRLHRNAPHVVHQLSFLLPCSSVFSKWWYRTGFLLYDFLAGKNAFHRARSLGKSACFAKVPNLIRQKTKGGILYSDGQFDDCRLLINILQTATEHGALVVNYARVETLEKNHAGRISGVRFRDLETGTEHCLEARCVINATGPFCDSVRQLDDPQSSPMVAASQGIHLVFRKDFFPGDTALIVPKTSDGRVLFAIPWYDHVVVGTTDTPIVKATLEPVAQESEITFLLETLRQYLSPAPERKDILSVFTGIRPLVSPGSSSGKTSSLSRDHTIRVSSSNLITITGGKWTTARKMAEDCVDQATDVCGLRKSDCVTQNLALHGSPDANANPPLSNRYGTDWPKICALNALSPEGPGPLVQGHTLTAGEVVWHVRHEMARTVEDVLARRHRMLFLDVDAATRAAPQVARLIANELGHPSLWEQSQIEALEQVARLFRC